MLAENKNLKDGATDLDISIKDTSFSISYTKTTKLITALYMVTDIIDRDEPLRNKLRTLGTEIISDIHTTPVNVLVKTSQVMSFLDIASAINIISAMNCNILRKEFLELNQSIKESTQTKPSWLEEFLLEPKSIGHTKIDGSKGQTRIGVQKGSTLLKALSKIGGMKALSDKTYHLSNGGSEARPNVLGLASRAQDFDILKKQRRADIINIIKIIGGSATIKDIKDKAQTIPEQANFLISCSEKTLQRELMSMIKDGVLNKTGKKRWSRYFIKN